MDEVLLVMYHHRHGIDTGIFRTVEGAQKMQEDAVSDSREEFNIDDSISNKEAVEDWSNLTDGQEYFEVRELPLQD